ncbi:MAG: ribosome recycling factor [Armatimonadetes bacterium CG2_30_59_28]|nr:ribosome recycling factor [Armatimonadota bacterium]OIO93371.1 MAG: ribosome recycling factor [Armatimonadetes bacterium CG2_30_59_28]PIU64996.1 MAG: ribosome recycling factor [Armatimonadetes bacterium CG07_land_8_20_14_0_80_59_28]PIX38170.1 MAG: ribosome recycling factor [Armatimonadetes bacterium CG_4_8_14_3_um_filter_58_9]PIY49166.1 MAG: ribosome recycling factor [Armatimonadetes bacterium CG_4_10_14_3_um_filter_59_10]
MPKEVVREMERKMKLSVEATAKDFASVRTGRASPTLLDRITVAYYGSQLPVNQVATITTPEPRTLIINPWDKSVMAALEKSISKSNLGYVPVRDGDIIRINIPQLTEERRVELAKVVAKKSENGRIAIRNIRREAREELEARKKAKDNPVSEDEVERLEEEVKKITERYIEEIDAHKEAKEADIMEV